MQSPPHSLLGDSLRLSYVENPGAFLGMGADWSAQVRWLAFSAVPTLVVLLGLWWVMRHIASRGFQPPAKVLGALLCVSGGIGNLIDRFARDGLVIDFLNVGVSSLRTGIFNIADVQILLGMALLLLWPSRKDGFAPRAAKGV
jgi:signal peptidase II